MGTKKKKTDASGGGDTNQAMTVSLFIIILAFFIMLNSIAVVDENRKRIALGSLLENFGILSGGPTVVEGSEEDIRPDNVSQILGLIDFSEMFKENDDITQALMISGDKRRSTLSIPERRLFKPGGATLIPESHPLLNKLGEIIRNNPYPVDIIGNVNRTDELSAQRMPPRELATLQAMALQVFLIQNAEVSPNRLTAYGWGEFRPAASNSTRETRSLNRRVEVVFFHEPKQKEPEGAFVFKDFFFKVLDRK
ncbi:MAG: OmpA family protein [Desulfobacterales bacterium]|jgi:chemotaxis protein MotB|nr:OmpA family protein [Desulfobacterales bacterium]